jgi:histidinol-phosphatase (PHP family)
MYYPDHHVHTRFSSDSQAAPEAHIERAIELGMADICFTDHMDPHYPIEYGYSFQLDPGPYLETMRSLQDQYKDRIQVRAGVEVGLQPAYVEETVSYMKSYPWDFVIGSIHLVKGADPYLDGYFDHRTEEEAYRSYFEDTLENLQVYEAAFDVLGHLDYVFRVGNQTVTDAWNAWPELMDEILHILVEKGIGLDINTGGFRKGLKMQHPHDHLLKRYRELGGELITFGSDAHDPAYLGAYFPQVGESLKALGFRYGASYKNRKPSFYSL